MANTQQIKNFSEQTGITIRDTKRLIKLADSAAKAQEQEHNRSNAPRSESLTSSIEKIAEKNQVKVIWPGLYPVFQKDGKQYHLPE